MANEQQILEPTKAKDELSKTIPVLKTQILLIKFQNISSDLRKY